MTLKEVKLEYTENTLVKLVRDNYGDNAVEYLVGRLSSVITESQLRIITEALGVPDNILDAADMLYDVVEQDIKTINTIQDEYTFDGEINFELGDKKKIKIDSYELKVNIEEVEDEEGVLDIISMGMGGGFGFNRDVYI